jgi:hypothetical protein
MSVKTESPARRLARPAGVLRGVGRAAPNRDAHVLPSPAAIPAHKFARGL